MQLYHVLRHLSSLRAFGQHKVQEEDVSRSRRKHGQGDSSFPCSDSMVSYLLSDLNVKCWIAISTFIVIKYFPGFIPLILSKKHIYHFLNSTFQEWRWQATHSHHIWLSTNKISSQGTLHHSACQSWPCGKHPSNPGLPTSVVMEGNMFRNMILWKLVGHVWKDVCIYTYEKYCMKI